MILAAVPVKRLADAKGRLATSLDADERTHLMLWMLANVVDALRTSQRIDRIALVTVEHELCGRYAVEHIGDAGDLNSSLLDAVAWAREADGLLVLPADLPLLGSDDVRIITDAPGSAIARTHDGGTGALLLRPPQAIEPTFGVDSFQRHVALAAAARVSLSVISTPGLTIDLDTPQDLAVLDRFIHPTAGQHARPD